MRVLLTDRSMGRRMYEVHERFGNKWWTASQHVLTDKWFVVNSRGTQIQEGGKLWEQIITACEAFAKEHVD